MRFLETLLYIGSVLFVIAYLVMLGLTLRNDKGRRTLILALRSLWLHKMRAMLSVLGIIIGTAAVISLMAFGEGSMQDALEDIKRQGATNIILRSVKPTDDAMTAAAPRSAAVTQTLCRPTAAAICSNVRPFSCFASMMISVASSRLSPPIVQRRYSTAGRRQHRDHWLR